MQSGAQEQRSDQGGDEEQEEEARRPFAGGRPLKRRMLSQTIRKPPTNNRAVGKPSAGGIAGPNEADDQHGKAFRRRGEGPPQQPGNIAMLDPQGKGDGGGHEEHRDVDDEQGLDVESMALSTLARRERSVTGGDPAWHRDDRKARRQGEESRLGAVAE